MVIAYGQRALGLQRSGDVSRSAGQASIGRSRFRFEKVDTNGEMTNVPALLGHWGGYRTSKAIAWVIDIGVSKPAWLARCREQCTNPMSLAKAKAAAMAMARNKWGDYWSESDSPSQRPNGHLA